MKRLSFLLLLLPILFSACKKDEKTVDIPTNQVDSLAVYYYNLRVHNQFEQYVDYMASCKNATPEYKAKVIQLLKQHQATINEKKGGIKSVSLARIEMHSDKMANAFLSIQYKDNTQEEVLFPLVLEGQNWEIQ